jgi:hypothetical protein
LEAVETAAKIVIRAKSRISDLVCDIGRDHTQPRSEKSRDVSTSVDMTQIHIANNRRWENRLKVVLAAGRVLDLEPEATRLPLQIYPAAYPPWM